MKKILITGGSGDIAKSIINELNKSSDYYLQAPGKEELDVTDIVGVNQYVNNFVPDILINNAGYIVPMSIVSCDITSERRTLDINLFGTFNCTAAVLRKNSKALIINIGSSAATKVHGTWASYCAAKAGVVMATKCWAEDGYDVICISPGRTATKMRRGLLPQEDQETLLRPSDFAKVILKAVDGNYERGTHINVTKENVREIIG